MTSEQYNALMHVESETARRRKSAQDTADALNRAGRDDDVSDGGSKKTKRMSLSAFDAMAGPMVAAPTEEVIVRGD